MTKAYLPSSTTSIAVARRTTMLEITLTRAPFQLAKSMEYPFHTLGDRFIFFLLSFFLRNSKCPVFLQLSKADFEKYDFIFGMDEENIQNIERVRPSASKAVGKGFPSQSLTSSSS